MSEKKCEKTNAKMTSSFRNTSTRSPKSDRRARTEGIDHDEMRLIQKHCQLSLSADETAELIRRLVEQGVTVPLVTDERYQVIDGRQRVQLALAANVCKENRSDTENTLPHNSYATINNIFFYIKGDDND